MRTLIRNQKGFTLLEVMMVVGLLTIFISIIYNFVDFNFRFMHDREREYNSYLQARVAMDRIVYLLQNYDEIAIDQDNNVVTGRNNEDKWENLINFNLNSDTSGIDGYRYFYFKPAGENSGKLLNENEQMLAEGIKHLNFKINENSTVLNVELEVISINNSDEVPLKLYTSLNLDRNIVPGH